MEKPRISPRRFLLFGTINVRMDGWQCTTIDRCGVGATPKEAFEDWENRLPRPFWMVSDVVSLS